MAQPTRRELEAELLALRAEVEELRARKPDDRSELMQRIMGDRVVLENMPEVICLLDRGANIEYLSRTTPNYSMERVMGAHAPNFLLPEHRYRFYEAFEHTWTMGTPTTFEFTSIAGRSWRTRLLPVWRDSEVRSIVASTLETTEHVRAVRELDSRLQHAVDLVGMGTWTYQWASDRMAWDDALCVIYGLGADEAPRCFRDFLERVHPDDRNRVIAAFAQARETGSCEELEHRIVRPSGELRHVRAKASALHGPLEEPGMLGAVFDVTDHKRLESQVYQRQKLEAMGELTAGIAHNFNNLLSIILPNIEMCRDDAPPVLQEHLADIEHAAQRAADLVRRLMVFTRHDVAVDKGALDPIATLHRTLEICRTTFDRMVRISLRIEDGVPNVLANAAQLEQVLLNICINARDALQDAQTPCPSIAIAIDRTPAGTVRVRVTDNGPGMDEATRTRVFEPFFTTKEVGRGTGLGLASAYAIIRDHGGRLSCESKPGEGATFEIELPAATRLPAGATQNELAARARPPRGSETILLVDDEALVRRAARTMLESSGYRVFECGDGDEALTFMQHMHEAVDLVVLDRSMPGQSGEQVFAKLEELAPATPVLLLSGQLTATPIAARVAAALTKPVTMDYLLRTIRDVLDRRPLASARSAG